MKYYHYLWHKIVHSTKYSFFSEKENIVIGDSKTKQEDLLNQREIVSFTLGDHL